MFSLSLFSASYLRPNSEIQSVHLSVCAVANDIKAIFKYYCADL
jgi:hypothetical protein